MKEILLFTPPTHLALIAVENIINFAAPVLVQFALETRVLAESNFALWVDAFQGRLLYFVAFEAFNLLDI